jgi:hypothetical protein
VQNPLNYHVAMKNQLSNSLAPNKRNEDDTSAEDRQELFLSRYSSVRSKCTVRGTVPFSRFTVPTETSSWFCREGTVPLLPV